MTDFNDLFRFSFELYRRLLYKGAKQFCKTKLFDIPRFLEYDSLRICISTQFPVTWLKAESLKMGHYVRLSNCLHGSKQLLQHANRRMIESGEFTSLLTERIVAKVFAQFPSKD